MNKRITVSILFIITLLGIGFAYDESENGSREKRKAMRVEYREKMKQESKILRQNRKEESKKFYESIADFSAEKQKQAVIKFHEDRYQENIKRIESRHQSRKDKVSGRINKSRRLSDDQKKQRQESIEKVRDELTSLRDEQHKNLMRFLNETEDNLSLKKRRKAIYKFRKNQNKEYQEKHKEIIAKYKADRNK